MQIMVAAIAATKASQISGHNSGHIITQWAVVLTYIVETWSQYWALWDSSFWFYINMGKAISLFNLDSSFS